jgi:hypothetical protein
VSEGVEDGRRLPALRASHPKNGHKAISGVVSLQGVEGSGMAVPGGTLGSLWPVATPCQTLIVLSEQMPEAVPHDLEWSTSGV